MSDDTHDVFQITGELVRVCDGGELRVGDEVTAVANHRTVLARSAHTNLDFATELFHAFCDDGDSARDDFERDGELGAELLHGLAGVCDNHVVIRHGGDNLFEEVCGSAALDEVAVRVNFVCTVNHHVEVAHFAHFLERDAEATALECGAPAGRNARHMDAFGLDAFGKAVHHVSCRAACAETDNHSVLDHVCGANACSLLEFIHRCH